MPRTPATTADASSQPKSKIPLRLAIGFVGLIVVMVVVQAVKFKFGKGDGSDIPKLTEQSLNDAQNAWKSRGPKNYDLKLGYSGGNKQDTIEMQVRDGKVVSVTKNGQSLSPGNDIWNAWTVDQQFKMIADDFDKLKRDGFGLPENSVATLYGEFDPEDGHPVRYARKVTGHSPLGFGWATEITIIDAPSQP